MWRKTRILKNEGFHCLNLGKKLGAIHSLSGAQVFYSTQREKEAPWEGVVVFQVRYIKLGTMSSPQNLQWKSSKYG